jgi:chaperone required for assembly of F1-ATPase
MSGGWAPRRFWTAARAEACEGGFTVRLDGRAVRTPAKAPFVVPTLAMAEAAAAEWDAQERIVRPETMPVTRSANSAIDKMALQFDDVVGLLTAYGETDLLCHRAEGPPALAARQAGAWDPLLAWAAAALGLRLVPTAGVRAVDQPPASLAALRAWLAARSRFELVAVHDLIALSGSAVLGLAVASGRLTADEGWQLSRIDEDWQISLWGEDEEATAAAAYRAGAFAEAARFWGLCR